MTKDLRDAQIEQQNNLIKYLTSSSLELKKELIEAQQQRDAMEQQRDAAIEEAILAKATAEATELAFNEPKYDLAETQCSLKETKQHLYELQTETKKLIKEASSVVSKIEKKLPKVTQVHSIEIGDAVATVPTPAEAAKIEELQGLINTLKETLESTSIANKAEKKERIKKVDLSIFCRTEDREKYAKSCILAYAKSQDFGLFEQFLTTPKLMEEALTCWFSIYHHQDELKKLSADKGMAYMKPYERAKRAFEHAVRQAKLDEYDWRNSK